MIKVTLLVSVLVGAAAQLELNLVPMMQQALAISKVLPRVPDCQCTMSTLFGGWTAATCAAGNDCIKINIMAFTPSQHGTCAQGDFCLVNRKCVTQKWRLKLTFDTLCGVTTCCPNDLATVDVDGVNKGNISRGGASLTVDVGGVEIVCGSGRIDDVTVTCLNGDGTPGAVVWQYNRGFLCDSCTP